MDHRALVIAVSVMVAGSAAAAREKAPVPVKLSPGGCWKYSGKMDGFVLRARAGEHLVITAAGEGDFMAGGVSWAAVKPRDITVASEDGTGTVVRPDDGSVYRFDRAGDYSITLWPQAIHGLPSMVIVCRAGPDTAE